MWSPVSQTAIVLFSKTITYFQNSHGFFFVFILQPGATVCYPASPLDLGAQTEVQIRMWPLEYPCVFPIVQFPDRKISESMPENAVRAMKTTAACTNTLCVTIHADNDNRNSLICSRWFTEAQHLLLKERTGLNTRCDVLPVTTENHFNYSLGLKKQTIMFTLIRLQQMSEMTAFLFKHYI